MHAQAIRLLALPGTRASLLPFPEFPDFL